MELTVEAMRTGGQSPIPFEELVEASETSIAILEAIATGKPVVLQMQQSAGDSASA